MNSTRGISGLTGGNLMEPPEPVLSTTEWNQRYGYVPVVPMRTPCPRPEPTAAQASRVFTHHAFTELRRSNPKTRWIQYVPFFDDEPTVRCEEVRCVSRV